MKIHIATTDTDIAACYPVMHELRPHIAEDQFLSRVRSQEASGYRLAFVLDSGNIIAVAGFRIGETLAWGRFLYVDDLITLPAYRSQGCGHKLLSWLKEYAAKEDCIQLHLDCGIQRKEAHHFYEREGMTVAGVHFTVNIAPNKALL